jgi:hypothetical protein
VFCASANHSRRQLNAFDARSDIRNHSNQGFGSEPDDKQEIGSRQRLCYIRVASEVSRMNESARYWYIGSECKSRDLVKVGAHPMQHRGFFLFQLRGIQSRHKPRKKYR